MIGLSIFGFLALNFLIIKLDEEAQHIKNAENSTWQATLSKYTVNLYCDRLQEVWKHRRDFVKNHYYTTNGIIRGIDTSLPVGIDHKEPSYICWENGELVYKNLCDPIFQFGVERVANLNNFNPSEFPKT